MLEEKEEVIQVLQTKINLLKEGATGYQENFQTDDRPQPEGGNAEDVLKKTTVEPDASFEGDSVALRDKVKRLETLLNKCKDTIKGNKERYSQIVQEKEKLSFLLVQESLKLQENQEKEAEVQAMLRADLQQMKDRLVYLEQQEEESIMAMAETKRNMHQELELKEKQLRQMRDELADISKEKTLIERNFDYLQQNINALQKKHEEEVSALNNQIKLMEKTVEEEKENLMQEFSRGKAEAFVLMQQECEKKITSIEKEWQEEILKLKDTHAEEKKDVEDNNQKLLDLQAKLLLAELNSKEEIEKMKEEVINIEKEKQDIISNFQNELFQSNLNHTKELEVWKAKVSCFEKENQEAYALHEVHSKDQLKLQNELEEIKQKIIILEKEKQDSVYNFQQKLLETKSKYQIEIENVESKTLDFKKEKQEEISFLKEKLINLELKLKEVASSEGAKMTEILILEEKLTLCESDYELKLKEMKKTITDIETEKKNEILDLEGKLIQVESAFSIKLEEMNDAIIAAEKEKDLAHIELKRLLSVEASFEDIKIRESDARKELSEKMKELDNLLDSLSKLQIDHETKIANVELNNNKLFARKDRCIEELTQKCILLEKAQREALIEFEAKMQDLVVKENDIISEYEKKLVDLRKELEYQTNENEEKRKKIEELQEKFQIQERMKAEIDLLNGQLDESLLVAEANQTASNKEMTMLKSKLDCIESERKLTEESRKNIEQKLYFFELENEELIKYKKYYEIAKQEKEVIESRLQLLEQEINLKEGMWKKKILKVKESDNLDTNNCNLLFFKDKSKNYEVKEEGSQRMTDILEYSLQNSLFDDSNSIETDPNICVDSVQINTYQTALEKLKNEYEEKLAHKETKLKYLVKYLIHHFSSQQTKITEENEQYLEEAIVKAKEQEDILLREHHTELSSLRQELFEKESAFEEMHEHYQLQLQEKEDKLCDLENRIASVPTNKPQKEVSDWEDEWVDTEELISSNVEAEKGDISLNELCSLQSMQNYSEPQNEVDHLKHIHELRISSSSRSTVPEITEFEYLRNILFQYMMGKEQLVLAKVIAAVLRFSADQTDQVLQREHSRQSQSRNLFT